MSTLIRRRMASSSLILAAAAALFTTLAVPAGASPGQVPQSRREVSVMTRNLYLGADFVPLLTTPADQLNNAVAGILMSVRLSQPEVRMQQVAREIHGASPDVVALQEAAVWTSSVPGVPALQYSYDFTAMVLSNLAAMGEHYVVAVDQANFDSLNDLVVGHLLPGRFVDHDVILVRQGTTVERTGAAHFAQQLTYSPTPIGPVTFTRGYVWADVRLPSNTVYRTVDVHFEAYSAAVAGAQAAELVSAVQASSKPALIAGDLNSDPDQASGAAAQALAAAGYTDIWHALHPDLAGFTCCEDGSLTGPADGSALDQRIDHVYADGPLTPSSASLVGVAAFESTAPMWPSDHAGLFASYVLR